jgi:hypothetical protein
MFVHRALTRIDYRIDDVIPGCTSPFGVRITRICRGQVRRSNGMVTLESRNRTPHGHRCITETTSTEMNEPVLEVHIHERFCLRFGIVAGICCFGFGFVTNAHTGSKTVSRETLVL